MTKAGSLTVNDGVPELDGTRLAIKVADDPFVAATEILESLGLTDGEGLWVAGTPGKVGTVKVLFIGQVGRVSMSAAEHVAGAPLGGYPLPIPATVKCKQCGYTNTVNFIDVHNLPGCQNPALPAHPLKVF